MPGEVCVMNDDEQPEQYQPPIGLAGLACLGCLGIVYLASRPCIGFLDRWGIEWVLYICMPFVTAFFILDASLWHREWGGVRRTLFMLLSACVVYIVAILVAGFAVVLASFVFGGSMVAG